MILLFTLALRGVSADRPRTATEVEIKGAWLSKFPLFVAWPTNAFRGDQSPIVLGILGTDPFGPDFRQVVQSPSAAVDGRSLEVRNLADVSQALECQVVFVSQSEQARLGPILQALRGRPIMVVGDVPGFAQSGGMVGFVRQGNSVQFEVNLEAAKAAGLGIRAKLLLLASRVLSGPAGTSGSAGPPPDRQEAALPVKP